MAQSKPREKLDVPAVAPLEHKLANLTRQRPTIGPAPRSAVLDQLAAFLPQMAQANERLKEQMELRPAAEFDIEAVEEGEEGEAPYIEMDLACGVLDLKDDAALQAAELAMQGKGGFLGEGGGGDDDDSSSSDDDSDEESSDEDVSSEDEGAGVSGGGSGGGEESEGGLRRGRGQGAAAAAGASGAEAMEVEVEESDGDAAGAAGAGPSTAARRGRGSKVATGPVAGGGLVGGRRRKVAAKRSKMIEEL